jgi:hypothetical protein
LIDSKATAERELRARWLDESSRNSLARRGTTSSAQARYREIYDRVQYLENGTGFNSDLFHYARLLVRGAAERAKPNEQRLREYADSNLPKLSAGVLAATPIYPEFETLTLGFSLDKMREVLGPDDDIIHRVLGKDSPDSLASRLVKSTKLADPAVRSGLARTAAVDAWQDLLMTCWPLGGSGRPGRRIPKTKCARCLLARSRRPLRGARRRRFTRTRRSRCGSAMATCAAGSKGSAGRAVHEARSTVRGATGEDPVSPAAALPRRAQQARSQHAVDFVTTNDIGAIPAARSSTPRPPGRPGARRQHPLDRGLVLVRREHEPRGGGPPRYDPTALRQAYGAEALASEILGGGRAPLLSRADRKPMQAVRTSSVPSATRRLDAELRLQDVEPPLARSFLRQRFLPALNSRLAS